MSDTNVQRPVNLDLTKFHFPPMAIISIAHRISGVILFLCIPLMLYLFHAAVASPASFMQLVNLLSTCFWLQLTVWVMLSAALFHLFAGIRHLIMDLGFGETVSAGRVSAYVVFAVTLIAIILLGVWIW